MKVAIAGYDVEGRATYDYARQVWPAAEIVIADERRIADVPPGVVDVLLSWVMPISSCAPLGWHRGGSRQMGQCGRPRMSSSHAAPRRSLA